MNHRLASAVVVAGLLFTACSGDDATDSSTTPDTPVVTTSTSSPATTQPGPTSTHGPSTSTTTTGSSSASTSEASTAPTSTAPASLETVLQGLLDRYDAAVTTILTDPTVTSDPAGPAVTAYLALFAPGSAFAQGALASWAQDAVDGHSYRPGPGGAMIESSLLELTSVAETEASFTVCAANSIQVLDAAGNVIESSGGATFVQAVAELVDGQWLLRDLSQSSGDCPKQGTGG